jgi:hypothetical protein
MYVVSSTPRPPRSSWKPAHALTEKDATETVDTLAPTIDLTGAGQLMSIIAAFKQSSNNPRVASRMKLVASADNLAPVTRQFSPRL